jgi:Mrp family chromosome partitioning ATPase
MIDILRSGDRRPSANAPVASEPTETETKSQAAQQRSSNDPHQDTVGPLLGDDDDVPFIEVGGPREPALRLVPAPLFSAGVAGDASGARVLGFGKQPTAASTPTPLPETRESGEKSALLTIRFQPVHAATLSGRGPVAELVAFHQPNHAVSGQYRALAAEISRHLPGSLPRVLLLAGAAEGVGTSTVLLNLAMTLAQQDATVTLVDANLARPALADRLGVPTAPGLREVLAGRMPATWCVHETVQSNLFVMPAGGVATPGDDYDLSPAVAALRDRNAWVVVDAGPWEDSPLVANLVGGCDAVYLVMRQESLAETAALQESVLQQTGRLRGCVLTAREV